MRVAGHVNVYSSCLIILSRQGWTVTTSLVPYEDDDTSTGLYTATRAGVELLADNPLELLGLSALAQASVPSEVPYWWSVEGPDESSRIFDEALVRAFWELQRRSPWDWADIVRSAVHGQSSLADALGVPEDDTERALRLLECEADVGLLVVQIHQERIGYRVDPAELLGWLSARLGGGVTRSATETDCVNYIIRHPSPQEAWRRVSGLLEQEALGDGLVVALCAQPGWRDYVLLHHYDASRRQA